jgi:hypothetical protein
MTIAETPQFIVSSQASSKIEVLLRVATKAFAFVEFATDEPVWIERVQVSQAAKPEAKYELGAAWKQEPKPDQVGVQWLFPFAEVEPNFGDHLSKWFEIYEALPLALDLYRVCKHSSELQVEFRYFSIVSALESLHRALFGEGPSPKCPACRRKQTMSLEQRLQEIVKKHGRWIKNLLSKSECRLVADTRNYLAHQTPALAAKSIPSPELFNWYRRLAMVFEVCILAELPFQRDEAVDRIIAKRWQSIADGTLGEWKF